MFPTRPQKRTLQGPSQGSLGALPLEGTRVNLRSGHRLPTDKAEASEWAEAPRGLDGTKDLEVSLINYHFLFQRAKSVHPLPPSPR